MRTHVEDFDLLCSVLEDEICVWRLRVEHGEGELVEHLFRKPDVGSEVAGIQITGRKVIQIAFTHCKDKMPKI
jgi:hypothetical protein